jgi:site-specific recombinase XerD
VKHALKRANIDAPAKGAHLLRHTAATEMLRNSSRLCKKHVTRNLEKSSR